MFLDIGAGVGLFSLAAASRGHRALAFELSPNSLHTFNESIVYNGFQKQIEVQEVSLQHASALPFHHPELEMDPCWLFLSSFAARISDCWEPCTLPVKGPGRSQLSLLQRCSWD